MANMTAEMINSFTEKAYALIPKLSTTLLILVIGYFAIKIITKIVCKFFDRVDFDRAVETFIENVVKIGLWLVLFVVLLSNLGIDVSGLIAGLGIMGFIVGFALKDTLGNLASGIFILFHKPFKVGDYVDVGGISGTVNSIGVAASEIHTIGNEKVTIPNSVIWKNPITNYTGLKWRRMDLTFGISYDDNINKAMKIIDDILKKDERILADPEYQMFVKELADNSVNIALRACAKTDVFMACKRDITKKVKEEFDKNKISIPFPQIDLHMIK